MILFLKYSIHLAVRFSSGVDEFKLGSSVPCLRLKPPPELAQVSVQYELAQKKSFRWYEVWVAVLDV